MAGHPIPNPPTNPLAGRIDAARDLLLFFRVGRRVQPAAVEALIDETLRRLALDPTPNT